MCGKTEFVEMLINQIAVCILDSRKPVGSETLFSREVMKSCEYQLAKLGREIHTGFGAESETMMTSLAGQVCQEFINF